MTNRVAFVTGASRGIGRAIALSAVPRAARIVVAVARGREQREGGRGDPRRRRRRR